MTEHGRRKQFVEVDVHYLIDGTVEPKRITMAEGKVFEIDEASDPHVTRSQAEGVIRRYPITIKGKRTFLYADGMKWWVMAKE